mgnify:CR=1 FL=1
MAERVSISEAAERLGVSVDTIRRRLKSGELTGEKVKSPQGFAWRVDLPVDAAPASDTPAMSSAPAADAVELVQLRERVSGLERLAEELKSERDAWREQAARDGDAAQQLRVLLQQAQALAQALPAHVEPSEAAHSVAFSGDAPESPRNAPSAAEPPSASDSSFVKGSAPVSRWASFWKRLRGE